MFCRFTSIDSRSGILPQFVKFNSSKLNASLKFNSSERFNSSEILIIFSKICKFKSFTFLICLFIFIKKPTKIRSGPIYIFLVKQIYLNNFLVVVIFKCTNKKSLQKAQQLKHKINKAVHINRFSRLGT